MTNLNCLIRLWWKSIFVGSATFHYHPAYLFKRLASARDFGIETLLKSETTFNVFWFCTKNLAIMGLTHTLT